jgi:tRNA-specific 2-thiouridylase
VNQLFKAVDQQKDQTYFLSYLHPNQLQKALFPVGHLTKPQVRQIALDACLAVAKKKDSTGICFIGERHFAQFLSNYLQPIPGEIKSLDGQLLGHHTGLINYTIGQRNGLGIGGRKDSQAPLYVIKKDLASNTLYVGPTQSPGLLSDTCLVTHVIWRGKRSYKQGACKFRYRQPDVKSHWQWREPDQLIVHYPPQKAVTTGQFCAFYHDDQCLGAGRIEKVWLGQEPR